MSRKEDDFRYQRVYEQTLMFEWGSLLERAAREKKLGAVRKALLNVQESDALETELVELRGMVAALLGDHSSDEVVMLNAGAAKFIQEVERIMSFGLSGRLSEAWAAIDSLERAWLELVADVADLYLVDLINRRAQLLGARVRATRPRDRRTRAGAGARRVTRGLPPRPHSISVEHRAVAKDLIADGLSERAARSAASGKIAQKYSVSKGAVTKRLRVEARENSDAT